MKNLRKASKIVLSLLFFACVLGVGTILTACGEDKNANNQNHVHSYTYVTTQDPTCTETGVQIGECACGHTVTVTLNALGHDWDDHIITEPTCELEGDESRTCKRCGEEELHHKIPAKGHNFTAWTHVQDSDSDHSNDYHTRHCLNEADNVQTEPCTYSPISHQAATCTAEGVTRLQCEGCQHEVDIIEQKLPHQFNEVYVKLTGENEGYHAKQCAKCDALDLENKELCSFTKNATTIAPTCESGGYTRTWCEHCDNYKDTNIQQAKGHDYETSPWEVVEDYDGDPTNNVHRRYCKNDDSHYEENNCHYTVKAEVVTDCETDGYTEYECSECKTTYRANEETHYGHAWKDEWEFVDDHDEEYTNDKHLHRCIRCEKTEELPCTNITERVDANCTENGYEVVKCSVCKKEKSRVELQSQGHQWAAEWQFDDNEHYRTCNVCGEYDRHAHIFKEERTSPTCQVEGQIKKYCMDEHCNFENITVVDKLSHNWSAWTPVVDDDTKCTRKCQNESYCHEVETELHDFAESNYCSKCKFDGLDYTLVGELGHEDSYYVLGKKVYDDKGNMAYRAAYGQAINAKNIIISGSYNQKPVKAITSHAFSSLKAGIQTLTIQGNNITEIDDFAFMGLNTLTSITLPASIKRIETYAFAHCPNLRTISCGPIEYVGAYAFSGTAYVNNKANWESNASALYLASHLMKVDSNFSGTFEIKENTLGIAESAFENCTNLIGVKFVHTIKDVFNNAFKNCPALSNVVFTGTVQQWLAINFMNDEASPLKEGVTFHIVDDTEEPDTTLDLSGYTFSSIPAGTFRNDENLVSIILPDSITSIGANAFSGCTNLATIQVGNKINVIGENAFLGTKFYSTLENWSSEDGAHNGILYLHSKDNSTHYLIATNESFNYATYEILPGTRVICTRAFAGQDELKTLTLPSSLRYIGQNAFAGCNISSATFVDAANSNWLASNSQIARTPKITDPATAASELKAYTGIWINNIKD